MSPRFWKRTKLCRVFVCQSDLRTAGLTGELGSLSRLLTVISTSPDIVASSGCPVDLIRTIDHHASFPRGVQSCFSFELLNLESLMHNSKYSVFGRIDMFSVLQCLLVSLGGSITGDWVLESSEHVGGKFTFVPWSTGKQKERDKHYKVTPGGHQVGGGQDP